MLWPVSIRPFWRFLRPFSFVIRSSSFSFFLLIRSLCATNCSCWSSCGCGGVCFNRFIHYLLGLRLHSASYGVILVVSRNDSLVIISNFSNWEYHPPCRSGGRRALKSRASLRFTRSTIFFCGWRIGVRSTCIRLSLSASLHRWLVNCVPLSLSTFCGFPTISTNSSNLFIGDSLVAFQSAYNFVYLLYVSVITVRCSYPYFFLSEGPKKSIDTYSSGYFDMTGSCMACNACVGSLSFWHDSHVASIFRMTPAKRGA